MIKIILSLFIILFSLNGCNTINTSTSELCKITDDICFYATNICKLSGNNSKVLEMRLSSLDRLSDISDKLKLFSQNLENNDNDKFQTVSSDDIYYLISLRNQLKEIYDDLNKQQ
jgi:hypothetical protein